MASKKLSPTLKAIQQKFFEEQGLVTVKQPPSKKNVGGVWPDKLTLVSTGEELEHVKDGMYKYIKSQTKTGFVQWYLEDINRLKSYKLIE